MQDTSHNREIIRPTLHHYALTVSNTGAMLDWYGKVTGEYARLERPRPERRAAHWSL